MTLFVILLYLGLAFMAYAIHVHRHLRALSVPMEMHDAIAFAAHDVRAFVQEAVAATRSFLQSMLKRRR